MHYSCPSCRRVFFESNPQGTCPECGAELVSTDGPRIPTGGGAVAGAHPVTLMGEEFLGDKVDSRQTAARPETARAPRTGVRPGPAARPSPPAAAAAARGRGVPSGAIAAIVILGAAVAALTAALLLRSPREAGAPDAAAKVAALEKRAMELETDNKELKEQNAKLSRANVGLTDKNATLTQGKTGFEQQLADLREEARKGAEVTRLMLGASRLLERRSNLERALEMADAALELGAGAAASAEANRLRGRLLEAAGRPGDALDAFEAAGDVEALVLAGETCLAHLADRDAALGCYKRAAELSGGTGGGAGRALGLVAEARVLFLNGDWSGAVRKAMQARKADPSLALAPLVIGEAAFGRAQESSAAKRRALLEKADPFLVEALKLDPNSARACLVRGRLLIEQNRLIEPERGFGLARFSRQDEAARLLSKAKDLSPRWAGVYVALGRLRLEKGALHNPALACTFAQEAVKLTEEKDATALATLASAYAATGSPAEAAKTVEKALKVDPDNDKLRSDLARYETEAQATSPHPGGGR